MSKKSGTILFTLKFLFRISFNYIDFDMPVEGKIVPGYLLLRKLFKRLYTSYHLRMTRMIVLLFEHFCQSDKLSRLYAGDFCLSTTFFLYQAIAMATPLNWKTFL
jgi:hypothetical protein